MRSTCAHPDCGQTIISDLAGEHWYHRGIPWPPPAHTARPTADIVHACSIPDPRCPGCTPEDVAARRIVTR